MSSYNIKLQKMVRELRVDIDATIVPLVKDYAPEYVQDGTPSVDAAPATYTRDGWADAIQSALSALLARWTSPLFRRAAAVIAGDFVRSSLSATDRRLKRTVGIDVFGSDNRLGEYIKAATNQNARLIESISTQYQGRVANIVEGNMRTGMRPSYIEKELTQQFGVTQRRAKMIARDQTAKVAGEINKQRQVNAGIKHFRWVTSKDSRVRDHHHVLADRVTKYGKGVYSWSDLPLENGVPVQPGGPVNCRCVAVGVPDFQVERNQQRGETNPEVSR